MKISHQQHRHRLIHEALHSNGQPGPPQALAAQRGGVTHSPPPHTLSGRKNFVLFCSLDPSNFAPALPPPPDRRPRRPGCIASYAPR
eukprot:6168373-Pyramimonas_sp.AAC.1